MQPASDETVAAEATEPALKTPAAQGSSLPELGALLTFSTPQRHRFLGYKVSTLSRRIRQQVGLLRSDDAPAYCVRVSPATMTSAKPSARTC